MHREAFQPVSTFDFGINRSERSHQVRWLAPLLARPEGRAWFLEQLDCPCSPEEAWTARVFHLCFPLRDIFTADYYQCRGNPELEYQFIAYYNDLFGLPEDFGVHEVWLTAPPQRDSPPSGWWARRLVRGFPAGAHS
jgi:hypothetical protein